MEMGGAPTREVSGTRIGESVRRDLVTGLLAWPLWTMLGWNDIRERYRRSVLGPIWITISMGLFIGLLGVIYSRLFSIELRTYLPYLTVGYVIWGFISSTLIESCGAFQQSERIIRQLRLPYSLYVFRVIWRSFIVFLHTVVIYVPVALYFGANPGWYCLLVFPGLLLLMVNLGWISLGLALLSTRFRDVLQMVTTVVQIAMFATPIMYPASALGHLSFVATANPLYHLIDLVRGPLLGIPPEPLSWIVCLALAAIGWPAAVFALHRAAKRLVFWL